MEYFTKNDDAIISTSRELAGYYREEVIARLVQELNSVHSERKQLGLKEKFINGHMVYQYDQTNLHFDPEVMAVEAVSDKRFLEKKNQFLQVEKQCDELQKRLDKRSCCSNQEGELCDPHKSWLDLLLKKKEEEYCSKFQDCSESYRSLVLDNSEGIREMRNHFEKLQLKIQHNRAKLDFRYQLIKEQISELHVICGILWRMKNKDIELIMTEVDIAIPVSRDEPFHKLHEFFNEDDGSVKPVLVT